jgi:5'-3' exoribonuclease 1
MGIKFFFKWLKKTYPSHIRTVSVHRPQDLPSVDHFLVDMNGIIHYACQKVHQYGQFEKKKEENEDDNDNIDVFDDDVGDSKQESSTSSTSSPTPTVEDEVTRILDRIIRFVRPKKSIFFAIDGVAPLSKQFQQRSRRFRSSKLSKFDSNSITPGTLFLDGLSNHIHRWITRKIRRDWAHLTVLFSSEKAPGEGEHKLVKWVREFGNTHDSFMMHGMDADLVMLGLATHFPHFHILRDNNYRPEVEFFHINLESIRPTLITSIIQTLSPFTDINHINDFIVMIFLTGNDFLPTIPTIELLDGGAEYIFGWYRTTLSEAGPLTTDSGGIRAEALARLLHNLSTHEAHFLETKRAQSARFRDRVLEEHTKMVTATIDLSADDAYDPDTNSNLWKVDFPAYRAAFYREKLGIDVADEGKVADVCNAYLEGVQWVLGYYLSGVPHWKWAYPYNYAPFLSDLAKYAAGLHRPSYVKWRDNAPFPPLLQLMCVLPRHSSDLLPPALCTVFDQFGDTAYPTECEIDIDGKFHEWEGVVKLPVLPWRDIQKTYNKLIRELGEDDMRRNRIGRTFQYTKDVRPTPHALLY